MSFIRRIKTKAGVYLAEVENKWIQGRCVQKHLRYVGKEVDGKRILSASISNLEVKQVKVYGPLLVLNHLAQEIELPKLLGSHGAEILSMVYAHCLDFKSLNQMSHWFERTDLNLLLNLEGLTEKRLLDALDSLEKADADNLQNRIFDSVRQRYQVRGSGIIYDVTNTYLYGRKCPLGKLGHDKEGVKGRPLIQIGLGVTQNEGIPRFHKAFDGNVHDARTLQELIATFERHQVKGGLIIYDRGITSDKNVRQIRELHWDTLCGVPIRGELKRIVRPLLVREKLVHLANRIRLNQTVWYARTIPYRLGGVTGCLVVCFNDQRQKLLRESRYDEIVQAQARLKENREIKPGLRHYFSRTGKLLEDKVAAAEEFDGVSCIFCTKPMPQAEIIRAYFDKDLVERAFRTLKGIAQLRPIRHWLYNRVVAHVFICYLSYLLLALLRYRLKRIGVSPEEALNQLATMYKVYLRDARKGFEISRVVTLTKKQELILGTISPQLKKEISKT